MGIFNDLTGGLLKGALNNLDSSTLSGVLSKVMQNTELGSVGGLLSKLQEAGLDKQVASWLSNGRNLPVDPAQLRDALGNKQLQELARSLGLPVDQALEVLSKHLPDTVDKMSPQGVLEVPATEEEPAEKEKPKKRRR